MEGNNINEETTRRIRERPNLDCVPVSTISVGERLREVGDVTSLAASIKKHGLDNPITIRKMPEGAASRYSLIAGARRLEAVKQLGDTHIHCIVHHMVNDDEARVIEITENLEREDLTAAERREWAKELLTVYERIEAASNATNDAKLSSRGRKGEGRPEGTASKVAKATGLSKRTVQRLQKDMQEAGEPSSSDKPKKQNRPKEQPTDWAQVYKSKIHEGFVGSGLRTEVTLTEIVARAAFEALRDREPDDTELARMVDVIDTAWSGRGPIHGTLGLAGFIAANMVGHYAVISEASEDHPMQVDYLPASAPSVAPNDDDIASEPESFTDEDIPAFLREGASGVLPAEQPETVE